ncbi:MAG: pyridoxamine 5'-phosphate oxidase [Euryarchaeota archaeon]|nr:pyridoxamine 5'-phosphate oxidase [Euryarchaeota archaeon]
MKPAGKPTRDGGEIFIVDNNKPLELLSVWINEAKDKGIIEPTAMSIATLNKSGFPTNRMVLAKYLYDEQIGFFTNLESDKSLEIIANKNVSATFWWPEMERQVRIEGQAEQMPREQVEEYHSTRPRRSRIAAWASDQSRELESMENLRERFLHYESKFENKIVPAPPFWGGFTIMINRVEYWSGRPNRLHERVSLTRNGDCWSEQRLFP